MHDWNTCPAEVAVNLLSSHMMSSGLVESKTLPHNVPQGESLATRIAVADMVKSRKATAVLFQPAMATVDRRLLAGVSKRTSDYFQQEWRSLVGMASHKWKHQSEVLQACLPFCPTMVAQELSTA